MTKVKFGKNEEGQTVAYADVTEKAKQLFDNVKLAYKIISTHYKVDGPLDEWKKAMKGWHSSGRSKMGLSLDENELYIEFLSGKVVEIRASEYCGIGALDRMIEII